MDKVSPAKDLSGVQYELDEKDKGGKRESGKEQEEKELAAAALTA